MPNPLYLPPDWVMLGIPQREGDVCLLASSKLSRAHLEQVANYQMDFLGGPLEAVDRTVTLTANMGDYVMVRATDYQEALRVLFAQWKPKAAERHELTTGPRALPR